MAQGKYLFKQVGNTPAFSHYIQMLEEELTPEQKKKVDKWGETRGSIKRLHDSVFGEGNERIEIPYDASKDVPLTTENYHQYTGNTQTAMHTRLVIHRLKKLGYRVTDYAKGHAVHEDSPDRVLSIGKILNKHGIAEEETPFLNKKGDKTMNLGQLFSADENRAAYSAEKKIVITRNKYDVAGMSTGRGWTSCMNMVKKDGFVNNSHFLPKDIREGTLTAYLAKTSDPDLKSPIGRINLKHFESRDWSSGSIFRPEQARYGSTTVGFPGQVEEWANKAYPAKPGIYVKHHSLYDDDGNSIRVEGDLTSLGNDHKKIIEHIEPMVRQTVSAYLDRMHKHGIGYEDDGDYGAGNVINKLVSGLPEKTHLLVNHHFLQEHVENESDNPYENDGFENHSLPLHIHAAHNFKRTFDAAKHELTDDELLSMHNDYDRIEDDVKSGHDSIREAHDSIIQEIFKRGNQPHIDHVLTHINDARSDHYKEMDVFSTPDGHKHPLSMTKNPRILGAMIEDELPYKHDFYTFRHNNFNAIEHIGRHGDEKLIHELLNDDDFNNTPDAHRSLIEGLNDNPDGEKIQHGLMDRLALFGGSGDRGQLKPIRDRHDLQLAMSGNSYARKRTGDPDDEWMFSKLAKHSKFPSIHQAFKNRQDLADFADELKTNPHLHESVSNHSNYKYGKRELTFTEFSKIYR